MLYWQDVVTKKFGGEACGDKIYRLNSIQYVGQRQLKIAQALFKCVLHDVADAVDVFLIHDRATRQADSIFI